jgi:hypothetical protein
MMERNDDENTHDPKDHDEIEKTAWSKKHMIE